MLKLLIDNDSGFTFATTLIIVSILLIIGTTLVSILAFSHRNVGWQLRFLKSFYIAEAGIARSWNVLEHWTDGLESLNDILLGIDGVANTDDDGVLSFGSGVDYGEGSYNVVVIDNDDGDGNDFDDSDDTAIIASTGIIGTVKRTINVMFAALPFVLNHAATTGGDIIISGGPIIQGSHGSVCATGDIIITGSPIIEGEVLSGDSTVLPQIDAEFYRSIADYELRSDGGVFDVANQNLTYSSEFNGWEWSGSEWTFTSSTAFDGTYYIQSDALVSGNAGEPGNPWKVTIIATGSIEISGNPIMQYETSALLLVTEGDIKINGNPDQFYAGAILAHEQIMISGSPILEGAIFAEDAENISDTVIENEMSGNLTLTYNGVISPLLPKVYTGDLEHLEWY